MCPKTERDVQFWDSLPKEKCRFWFMRVAPQRGYNPNRARCPLFGKSSLQRESGHTLTPAAIARSWRRLKRCVAGLLCGTGVLCCRAWPAVRAEDGHLHAAVLLPVVPGLFVIHRLVLSESFDLWTVPVHISLRFPVGSPTLSAPSAYLPLSFRPSAPPPAPVNR